MRVEDDLRVKVLSFLSLALLAFDGSSGWAKNETPCGNGQYRVRSHPRRAYYKANGRYVRASQVSSSCRDKRKEYDVWFDRLKSGTPPSWPHKIEKPANWT